MTKKELRKEFLQRRLSLTPAAHHELSVQLANLFLTSIDLHAIETIHCYLPLESKKEPDTWLIINRIQREFSDIRIILPKVNAVTSLVENFYFEGEHQLKQSEWGIAEPHEGARAYPEEIDLVIVPLLVFDLKGNRAGYGKGFYDRFLKECRMDCKKIGLSFFEPVDKIDDVNAFDIALTGAVTPEKIYSF